MVAKNLVSGGGSLCPMAVVVSVKYSTKFRLMLMTDDMPDPDLYKKTSQL